MNNVEFKNMVESAINAFEKQGEPAISGSACVYSGKGLHCVVGFMMPDEETRLDADTEECSAISSIHSAGFEWAQQFSQEQVDLMSDLQDMHDLLMYEYATSFNQIVSQMRERLCTSEL